MIIELRFWPFEICHQRRAVEEEAVAQRAVVGTPGVEAEIVLVFQVISHLNSGGFTCLYWGKQAKKILSTISEPCRLIGQE